MKYNISKEVKNILYILFTFFSFKYVYSLVSILIFDLYNKIIPVPSYLLSYNILFLIIPIFYFYKIEKKDSIKKQIIFIIRNNFVFCLFFIILDYLYSLLFILTKKIFIISGYDTLGNFCSTNLSNNLLYFIGYIFFLFLLYNISVIFFVLIILKISKFNFLSIKKNN